MYWGIACYCIVSSDQKHTSKLSRQRSLGLLCNMKSPFSHVLHLCWHHIVITEMAQRISLALICGCIWQWTRPLAGIAEGRNRTQWPQHFIPIKVSWSKIHPKQHPRLCNNLAGNINVRYVWLSRSSINCLHMVQNAHSQRKHEDIFLILASLQCLLIHSRIHFKILVYVFESLNGLAPPNLSDLIHPYVPTCFLRSADQLKVQRRSCFSCYGSKIMEPPASVRQTGLLYVWF